jgi:hypothetical protein
MPEQMPEQGFSGGSEVDVHIETPKVRHGKSAHAARIDAGERFEIEIDVQGHAVVTRATPYAQTDTGDLATVGIDTRRIGPAPALDVKRPQKVYHGLFESGYQVADTETGTLQVD